LLILAIVIEEARPPPAPRSCEGRLTVEHDQVSGWTHRDSKIQSWIEEQ
jgi:hypothetical protein